MVALQSSKCKSEIDFSKLLRVAFVLAAIVCIANIASAQLIFREASYGVGRSPNAVAIADFNGDGWPDIATANGDGTVSILLNNKNGTFAPATSIVVGGSLSAITTAHFTGSANIDIAVIDSEDKLLFVLPGNGDGTFKSPIFTPLVEQAGTLAAGDFLKNGIQDLAIADGGNLSIWLGKGDGTFSEAETHQLNNDSGIQNLVIADFNGDTYPDIAESGGEVYLNVSFVPKTPVLFSLHSTLPFNYNEPPIPLPLPVEGITGGDFRNTGLTDLIGVSDSNTGNTFVTEEDSLGGGSFTDLLFGPYSIAGDQDYVRPGDFNGDGNLGVVLTTNNGSNFVYFYFGNGTGAFTGPYTFYIADADASEPAVGDFNEDGISDVALADPANNSVDVMLSGGSTSTTAISSSFNPTYPGASVTFTAAVSGTGGTPTGTLSFEYNGTIVGPLPLNSSNSASFKTSFNAPGTVTVYAYYSGDAEFAESNSSLVETINTGPGLSSLTPDSVQEGSPTFTLTVNGTQFDPTSVVDFGKLGLTTNYLSSTQLTAIVPASAVLQPGAVTVTVSDTKSSQVLPVGTFTITDAPLSASGVTITAPLASSFSSPMAYFTSGDVHSTASNFAPSTINWGDGSQSAAIIAAASKPGNFIASGTHIYQLPEQYQATVSIRDVGGNSAQAVSVVNVNPLPNVLTASTAGRSAINLAWNVTSGVIASYSIQEENPNGTFSTIGTAAGPATSYTATGLYGSSKYTFRLLANTSFGTSVASNTASATTLGAPIVIFPQGLSLISLPYNYSNTALDGAAILGLPIKANGQADIAWFNPTSNTYTLYPVLPGANTRQTEPGLGYWIDEPAADDFYSAGQADPSPFTQTLQPGWNLVGDPFTSPMAYDSAEFSVDFQVGSSPAGAWLSLSQAQDAGITDRPLYAYDQPGNSYIKSTQLLPFTGYWLYIDGSASKGQTVQMKLTGSGE